MLVKRLPGQPPYRGAIMHAPDEESLLAQCASEPIHRLGRTQPFGLLLAFDGQRRIAAVSANARDWCGQPPAAMLDHPVTQWLPELNVAAAEAHARLAGGLGVVQHLFGVPWPGREELVDLSLHTSGALVVLEAEPCGPVPARATQVMETCTRELAQAAELGTIADSAARAVAGITGFDRVMVYRFAADGSGTVVAERVAAGLQPYIGLRYPASDIPDQARRLYLRNPTRLIVDAHDDGQPLCLRDGEPPDLSLSVLRSVSPVHLQYMRNMGSAASMSISLIVDGRLWGLIACHHGRPIRPSLPCRALAALLGRLYSLAISRVERHGLDQDIKALLLTPPGVEPLVAAAADPEVIERTGATLQALFGLSGCVARIDGAVLRLGRTPERPEIDRLLAGLPRQDAPPVLAIESLASVHTAWRRYAPLAAGALALRLDDAGRNWVLLLRDEVRRHVTWAGNPNKAVNVSTGMLTPRASFAAWQAAVKWHCEPWSPADIELAGVLRVRLLEVLLAQREQRELRSAREATRQQALLVRELNHRVRNMLGLIRGLVQQTAQGSPTVDDLARQLDHRVQAMSRAYTQVERAGWRPTPLASLLADEAAAFSETGQVDAAGDAVLLDPGTCLSLALVVHELATNARKYGALSTPGGRLAVRWRHRGPSGLVLEWTETGGPPTQPPRRQGFGTKLIEQASTRQLGGGVAFDYRPEGLRVTLTLARGVSLSALPSPAPARVPAAAAVAAVPQSVLVVEDDPVIALLAESSLHGLGVAQVAVAGNAADALRLLKQRRFDLALLDVNLGDHDSAGVARRLARLGTPALVTTGYSDPDGLPSALRRLTRLCKPYAQADLERAIAQAGAGLRPASAGSSAAAHGRVPTGSTPDGTAPPRAAARGGARP